MLIFHAACFGLRLLLMLTVLLSGRLAQMRLSGGRGAGGKAVWTHWSGPDAAARVHYRHSGDFFLEEKVCLASSRRSLDYLGGL